MRKKKFTKVTAGLLAAIMVLGMTACGEKQEETPDNNNPVEDVADVAEVKEVSFPLDEEVTFTIAGKYKTGATADWASTVQFQEYKNRLGINLEPTTYDEETWSTKFTLMLAEDDLPDIIAGAAIQPGDMVKYARDGYFLDFSKYLDQMPNLSAIFEAYPEYKEAVTMEDGGIYGFSSLSTYTDSAYSSPAYMNQSWLDRLGLEQPETVEDLYDVLKAFKEQDANGNGDPNDEVPMTVLSPARADAFSPIRWAYGIYENGQAIWWEQVDENGQVQLMDVSDNAKEFYRFAHQLYEEGLINQDAFTAESGAYLDLAFSDKVGYVGGAQPSTDLENHAQNQWYQQGGLTKEGYNEEPVMVVGLRINNWFDVAVNANVENVDVVVKFIDYLFSEEGSISASNGYEGISFDYVDLCGFDSIDASAYAEGYETTEEYRIQKAVASNALTVLKPEKGFWEMIENIDEAELLSDEVLQVASVNAVQEKTFRSGKYKVIKKFPNLRYSEEVLEERTTIRTDIINYLKTASAQFITGEMDVDKDWDTYLEQLESLKLSRLMEIEQAAYDEYIGK